MLTIRSQKGNLEYLGNPAYAVIQELYQKSVIGNI